jgi:hypothetical protein
MVRNGEIRGALLAGALTAVLCLLSCTRESPAPAPAPVAAPNPREGIVIGREGALASITGPARLVIAGDFHARSGEFEAWLEASNVVKSILSDDCTVAVLLGDVVDRKSAKDPAPEDGDSRIVARIRAILKELGDRANRFILIQGNHEWEGTRAWAMLKAKGMTPANRDAMVDELFHSAKGSFYRQFNFLERMDDDTFEFLRSLPFFVTTDRGIVCAHAGPPQSEAGRKEVVEAQEAILRDLVWGRAREIKEGGYTMEHVERFLQVLGGAKLLVSGHTPLKSLPSGWVRDGVGTFGERQVILATGYGHEGGRQAWLDLEGGKTYDGTKDLRAGIEIRTLAPKGSGK